MSDETGSQQRMSDKFILGFSVLIGFIAYAASGSNDVSGIFLGSGVAMVFIIILGVTRFLLEIYEKKFQ